jgi:hypothetical protein
MKKQQLQKREKAMFQLIEKCYHLKAEMEEVHRGG